MYRRTFFKVLPLGTSYLVGLPVAPVYNAVKEKKFVKLKILKEAHLRDFFHDLKYPAMNVFSALCREENYKLIGDLFEEHFEKYSELKQKPVTKENQNLDEAIKQATSIVSKVTNFDYQGSIVVKEGNIPEILEKVSDSIPLLLSLAMLWSSYILSKYVENKIPDNILPYYLLPFFSGAIGGISLPKYFEGDEFITIKGEYKDGKSYVRNLESVPVRTIIHEIAHNFFDLSGASDAYSLTINEGFARGIENIGTKIYDKENNTNYNLISELMQTFYHYIIYEYLSSISKFEKIPNAEEVKKKLNLPPTSTEFLKTISSKLINPSSVGTVAFQILEKKVGQEIYPMILRKQDKPLEKLVYGK